MLRVDVHAKAVAGTDRGGEDLYLVFETDTTKRPNLKKPGGFVVNMSEVGNVGCNGRALEDNSDIIRKIRYTTYHNEFKWEGTEDDLIEIVASKLKDKQYWSRPFDGKKFSFKYEHFVHGNAD